ncbi:MAG: dTDP-4-dehydrorhamnose 3,5-epimerase [Solirubrobacteraceae bacterium]|nr:dTDP-4-dehydrorhamnose 3,5-epimerase [Solirubrobacteraceae bacterium]
MQVRELRIPGALVIEPAVHGDARGFFCETYREPQWSEHGIPSHWAQDNHSRSGKGVLRGMHFAIGEGQAKLVRCARGRILDVVVDLRADSPTYGEWEGVELSDENMHQLYVPIGLAHGFVVLSDVADVTYKCTTVYDPEVERGIAYDDPEVAIEWPTDIELLVSERDANARLLSDLSDTLPFRYKR